MNVVTKSEYPVPFYLDCDDELHRLPREDVHKFTDRVFDPFPSRKNGRYGATVVMLTTDSGSDPTLERRALARAKHLIGLHKQQVKRGLRSHLVGGEG